MIPDKSSCFRDGGRASPRKYSMWLRPINFLLLFTALCTKPCLAIEPASTSSGITQKSTGSLGAGDEGWFMKLWGKPSTNKIYLGMWSDHFLSGNGDKKVQHDLIGTTYSGYFFGTFLNSHDDRTWGVGVQRDLSRVHKGPLLLEFGYRGGLMYGYKDSYQIGDTGLFPLFQLLGDVSYGPVGLQFSWAVEVVTAGFFIRLD